MEALYVIMYVIVMALWLFGIREAYDRGFAYVVASVLLWPIGFALGVTRLFRSE